MERRRHFFSIRNLFTSGFEFLIRRTGGGRKQPTWRKTE
jgi:hypothetical protein